LKIIISFAPAAPTEDKETADDALKNIAELDMDDFLSGNFLTAHGGVPADDGSGSDEEEGSDFDSEEEADLDDLSDSDEEKPAVVKRGGAKKSAAAKQAEEEEEESDDDDDDDNEDGDGIGAQNARFQDEIAAHKAQLEKLKEADPEFYEYLAATDKELLDFGAHDESEQEDDSEEEEQSEEEEEGSEDEKPVAKASKEAKTDVPAVEKGTITLAMVDTWCAAAKEHAALGAMRNILRAYRSACHYGDSEEQVEATLRLGSSAVYNKLMLFVLREADGIFKRILGIENEENFEAVALGKLPRWKKVEPLVKSYIGNTLHLLGKSFFLILIVK
jgi:nucleolar complex protein 2